MRLVLLIAHLIAKQILMECGNEFEFIRGSGSNFRSRQREIVFIRMYII